MPNLKAQIYFSLQMRSSVLRIMSFLIIWVFLIFNCQKQKIKAGWITFKLIKYFIRFIYSYETKAIIAYNNFTNAVADTGGAIYIEAGSAKYL